MNLTVGSFNLNNYFLRFNFKGAGMDLEAVADHTANVATAAPEPSTPGQHVPVEEPNPAPVPMKDPDPSPAPMKNPEPPTPSRRSSGHRASMKG